MKARALRVRLSVALLAVAACSDGDPPPTDPGSGTGFVEVRSDPSGGRVFLDGQDRGRVTPDTIRGLSGRHEILVRIDSAGATYGYRVQLTVPPDSIVRVTGPLMLARCVQNSCPLVEAHTPNRIRFSRSPAGPLFYTTGAGNGLLWPVANANSYASNGVPVFAALIGGTDSVSTGIYDMAYYAGRPFPSVRIAADLFSLRQSFWVLPPPAFLNFVTARGMEITEEVIGSPNRDDVVVVRVTFRNVTDRESYRASDPVIRPGGVRFERAFIGFALDADIGVAADDLFTYDPDLNAVIAYDAAFREDEYSGGFASKPGLVGLRILDAPAGTRRILNGWPNILGGNPIGDWGAGRGSEGAGYIILSGTRSYTPDHPEDIIGHLAGIIPNDYRLAVSAGPITLAPNDSASITVAIALAEPVAGTFTSGTAIDSGEPRTRDRPIMRVAAALLERLRAAEGIR
jgi:hypothetical protein